MTKALLYFDILPQDLVDVYICASKILCVKDCVLVNEHRESDYYKCKSNSLVHKPNTGFSQLKKATITKKYTV